VPLDYSVVPPALYTQFTLFGLLSPSCPHFTATCSRQLS
jgi:hypothetical protein